MLWEHFMWDSLFTTCNIYSMQVPCFDSICQSYVCFLILWCDDHLFQLCVNQILVVSHWLLVIDLFVIPVCVNQILVVSHWLLAIDLFATPEYINQILVSYWSLVIDPFAIPVWSDSCCFSLIVSDWPICNPSMCQSDSCCFSQIVSGDVFFSAPV